MHSFDTIIDNTFSAESKVEHYTVRWQRWLLNNNNRLFFFPRLTGFFLVYSIKSIFPFDSHPLQHHFRGKSKVLILFTTFFRAIEFNMENSRILDIFYWQIYETFFHCHFKAQNYSSYLLNNLRPNWKNNNGEFAQAPTIAHHCSQGLVVRPRRGSPCNDIRATRNLACGERQVRARVPHCMTLVYASGTYLRATNRAELFQVTRHVWKIKNSRFIDD